MSARVDGSWLSEESWVMLARYDSGLGWAELGGSASGRWRSPVSRQMMQREILRLPLLLLWEGLVEESSECYYIKTALTAFC